MTKLLQTPPPRTERNGPRSPRRRDVDVASGRRADRIVRRFGAYRGDRKEKPPAKAVPPVAKRDFTPTEDNILGPFYRERAPYRAKVTPPLAPGTALLVGGRVWGVDTRAPLAGATIDIWQANAHGRYDNDDPRHPPAPDVFRYRVRLVTDETGRTSSRPSTRADTRSRPTSGDRATFTTSCVPPHTRRSSRSSTSRAIP